MTPNLNDPTSEAPLLSAEPSRRSGHDLKRLIFCVLGLGVCGILLLPTTRQELAKTANVQAATTEQTEVLPVETVIAKPVDGYSVQRTYTGALAAQRSSDLGFERGGRLVAVLVQEGDRIRQDQPLARLDTSNLRTQRRQLEAEKVRAMAQLAELRAGPRAEDIAAAEA
ncbi:MAG: biotin/lipoyl-binding protein, partial [Cyanobacteria bacterium P01_F01_bin.3]